jgi:hypothetical protein
MDKMNVVDVDALELPELYELCQMPQKIGSNREQ